MHGRATLSLRRLRISEIENRSEVDRLKADSQDEQLKLQQLERELISLRLERSNADHNAVNVKEMLQLSTSDSRGLSLEPSRITRLERTRVDGVERETRLHETGASTGIARTQQGQPGRRATIETRILLFPLLLLLLLLHRTNTQSMHLLCLSTKNTD